MELKIFDSNNNLTETYTNETYIITKLLGLLFNQNIAKSSEIKRIEYNHNYTNRQTVIVHQKNGYKLTFSNVPTMGATLDEGVIEKILKEGGNA